MASSKANPGGGLRNRLLRDRGRLVLFRMPRPFRYTPTGLHDGCGESPETHLQTQTSQRNRVAKFHGRLGALLLLLIISVKAARWLGFNGSSVFLVGIAPSLLGPAGIFFMLLSRKRNLTRRCLFQTTLLVLAIALGLEFAQLLPRPGILAKVRYTFDWWDVVASVLSLCVASGVALITTETHPPDHHAGP
jgi:hypothetical protein